MAAIETIAAAATALPATGDGAVGDEAAAAVRRGEEAAAAQAAQQARSIPAI